MHMIHIPSCYDSSYWLKHWLDAFIIMHNDNYLHSQGVQGNQQNTSMKQQIILITLIIQTFFFNFFISLSWNNYSSTLAGSVFHHHNLWPVVQGQRNILQPRENSPDSGQSMMYEDPWPIGFLDCVVMEKGSGYGSFGLLNQNPSSHWLRAEDEICPLLHRLDTVDLFHFSLLSDTLKRVSKAQVSTFNSPYRLFRNFCVWCNWSIMRWSWYSAA